MSYNFIPGIASQSLGHPSYHPLIPKLEAASHAGLRSIEIFYEDISNLTTATQNDTSLLPPRFTVCKAGTSLTGSTSREETELACCQYIRQTCLDLSLQIICLQPFTHYEGLLDGNERHSRIRKLHYWIKMAQRIGTDLIQIPSNFLPASQCTNVRSEIINDLQTAADIGAQEHPPIRFAYEALAWGTHVNLWNDAFDIVKAVNRPNFGTCLDTFNLAGRVYADPTATTGLNENAANDIAASIHKLRTTLADPENLKKVFYVELCDGERLPHPIDEHHEWYDESQPARMTWSRNARLYPFETDAAEAAAQNRNVGYLPVTQILDTVLDAGYQGYISFEVFNRSLNRSGEHVVREHAERAKRSWERCQSYIDAHLQAQAEVHEHLPHDETLLADEHDVDNTTVSLVGQEKQPRPGLESSTSDYAGISSRL
ncbi:hypothetical protein H2198_004246 [Neophaeococcomyces mojaviensis]|uniref:Uncharacterized protein n=1 Tax=Neophaeococcomyces mojaviensis TaxID=3383035 RepID=A0ACC3A9J4_9EURO|nr:hypothetical protein H2198_004246 [Knufia sp. JES_112]